MNLVDIIIVGSGPAGMTAALYALRANKTVTVIEKETIGGQIAISPRLENFPSIMSISGEEFSDKLFEQITELGANLEIDEINNCCIVHGFQRGLDDSLKEEVTLLEERLKSRFEWGILADISMPDYETRLAILRKKVQADKIIIDDYILSVIATKIDSNIRELEGALNKIVAYASLTHSPITIEIAEKSINDIVLQKEKVISSDYIQEVVAKYFNIDKKDIISSKKSNDIAFPRQIAMFLCRNVAGMSFPKIGADFGNRDHTTVMHAVNKIEKEIKEKTNTKLIVESVKNIIQDSN